jgi:nucleosome binding factor SPN SPT16 subunit
MVNRLHIQKTFRERYGDIAWNRNTREEQEEAQKARQDAQQEGFEAVQEENAWLMKNARDNMSRGITAPTNPTIEKIVSYAGQTNKSRTSRPLDDSDVGLKGIEDL